MPIFITRVELPAATSKDYQELEAEMKKAAFKDVKKTAGKRLFVNLAEFNRRGHSLLEVTGAAAKAVRKTGKNYSFTVIRERRPSLH
jgi:hypothetical protein